jgi:inorganic pyrophosphatase
MRLDAIAIGHNPPDDVNVVIEVSIGGEPIKYEMDKAAGTLVVDRFLHTQCAILATTGLCRTRSRRTAIRSTC